MTNLLNRLPLLLALLGGLPMVAGCPKDGQVDQIGEEDLQNPVKLYQNGVAILQTPDKLGVVNYSTAYSRFTNSAALFADKGDKAEAAKAHFNAAWTAEVLAQPADAEKHYRAAYEADPTYERAMFSLARVLSEQGKHAEAVGIYRGYVDSHPDNLGARNDLVVALSAAGLYDEAIAEAQQILLKDPKNATVYRNLSAMYYAQGNYGMSQLCAEKSLALNQGDSGTYNNMGVTYLLQEDEPAAIEKFKTAIQLDADNFEANMNLGFVALNSGDYALALASLEKAVTADPTSIEAKLGLAVALRGTKDYTRSAALYDEIIKAAPQTDLAYFNAATLHERYTKDYTRALKYLEAFVSVKSGTIGPDHEVFARMDQVKQSKAAEEARIAEQKRLEQERKEREARQRAVLEELKGMGTDIAARLPSCPEDLKMELEMMLEQLNAVVEANDIQMAPDVKSMFTDYYLPQMDAMCGGAAPAPEEGGTPDEAAPTE